MTDYFEWKGTEKSLEDLLIWWSTREPFVHAEDCLGEENTLHCCLGFFPSHAYLYGLESPYVAPPRPVDPEIPLVFVGPLGKHNVFVGDRIYYSGDYIYRLEHA